MSIYIYLVGEKVYLYKELKSYAHWRRIIRVWVFRGTIIRAFQKTMNENRFKNIFLLKILFHKNGCKLNTNNIILNENIQMYKIAV